MHRWPFRKRWGIALFACCVAGAWVGLSFNFAPFFWLVCMVFMLPFAWWGKLISRPTRHTLTFVTIALSVACFARFGEVNYDMWQTTYSRAESGTITGRVVDVLPDGVDQVIIEIEIGLTDESSLFTKRLLHGRPLIRVVTTLPELTMMKGADQVQHNRHPSIVRWPVRLYPFQPAGNPGEFDARRWAMRNGWVATAYPDEGFFDATGEYARSEVIGPCLYGEALSLVSLSSPLKSWLRHVAARWRCKLGEADGPGAVAVGLILGQKDLIDNKLRDRMSRAGIAHLLAVSGLHVSFVLLLFVPIVRTVPTPVGSVLIIFIVVFFVSLVGGPPSAVRAGTMAMLVSMARLFGRSVDPWHLIGIVGAGLVLWQPLFIYDVGFQLSFLALIGIIGVGAIFETRRSAPHLNRLENMRRAITRAFIASTGAQMTTWPVVANGFSSFSWIAPFSNLLAIPLAGVALGSLLLGIVLWEFAPLAGDPIIMFGKAILQLLIGMADKMGDFGSFEVSMLSPLFVVGWYAAVTGCILLFQSVTRPHHGILPIIGKRAVMIGFCFIVVSYGWWLSLDLLGVVDVWVLDVGQGDSVIIKGPWERAIIIDGGGVPGAAALGGFDVGERVVVPTLKRLGVRRLDMMVNTHPHEDHLHGLVAVLKNRTVGRVYGSEAAGTGTAYRHFLATLDEQGIDMRHFEQDDVFSIGSGFSFSVLAGGTFNEWIEEAGRKPNVNDMSVAFLMDHPGGNMLFLGDLEIRGQERLWSRQESGHVFLPDSDEYNVMLVPHHGGKSSLFRPLWDEFSPDFAIISAGAFNRYNHPAREVVDYFKQKEIPLKRTDRNGATRVRFWPWGVTVATVH